MCGFSLEGDSGQLGEFHSDPPFGLKFFAGTGILNFLVISFFTKVGLDVMRCIFNIQIIAVMQLDEGSVGGLGTPRTSVLDWPSYIHRCSKGHGNKATVEAAKVSNFQTLLFQGLAFKGGQMSRSC